VATWNRERLASKSRSLTISLWQQSEFGRAEAGKVNVYARLKQACKHAKIASKGKEICGDNG
jgi:hypothetical protein